MSLINITPFGLPIRTKRSAYIGALIVLQAEPAQTIHDLLLRACYGAL